MKVIFVMSGKGGVGKTTVSVNLAYSLEGKVGLMDADIHGPNVPNMLGIKEEIRMREDMMLPVEHDGLKVMSIGFMLKKNDSVAWRGPMKHNLISQFIQKTEWGELDYLVVDLPPGTGDEALSAIQLLKNYENGAVIVSTPQKVSIQDTLRCIDFCKQTGINITGIIENMSGGLFGQDTLTEVANSTGNDFLGKLSLDENIVKAGEQGVSFTGDNGQLDVEFQRIVKKVKNNLG